MAKENFNRKISIFCWPLEKEVRKKLVKYFVWSAALYGAETWTLRRNDKKRLEVFDTWIWRRMEHGKWTNKIKHSVVLERVRWKNNARTDKEEENKLPGPLAKKELSAEGCFRRNGKREEVSWQKKMSDDRQHDDKWTVCRYQKEGGEEGRVENAAIALKDQPLGRID